MATTQPASTIGLDTVADLAAQLRVDSVRSSTSAEHYDAVGDARQRAEVVEMMMIDNRTSIGSNRACRWA